MEGENKLKTKRARSSSYPSTDLEKSIQQVQAVKANLGKGPFSRDSAAKALGYGGVNGKSGTIIATLAHYGLLTKHSDTYSVSDLSDEILTYRDEAEKHSAIAKAAKHPKLYAALIKAYEGKSLPVMLEHILVREYGIGENAAPTASKAFRKTMEFSGLLVNGVLHSSVDLDSSGSSDRDQSAPGTQEEKETTNKVNSEHLPTLTNMQHVEIGDGVILSYRGDLAFTLFTTPAFASALQALQKSLPTLSKQTEQNHIEKPKENDEPS